MGALWRDDSSGCSSAALEGSKAHRTALCRPPRSPPHRIEHHCTAHHTTPHRTALHITAPHCTPPHRTARVSHVAPCPMMKKISRGQDTPAAAKPMDRRPVGPHAPPVPRALLLPACPCPACLPCLLACPACAGGSIPSHCSLAWLGPWVARCWCPMSNVMRAEDT